MRPNPLRQAWSEGTALGAWLSIASPFTAEVVARQPFDYVCIDLQHGLVDGAAAVPMLQAMQGQMPAALVRVPSNDFAAINKVLDAGALGVVVPMVNTPEEAAAAVRAVRYPPDGERSFGPTRAAMSEGPDYFAHANRELVLAVMVETAPGLENVDAIAAVPGVDAIYVGPNDLSLALGQGPGVDPGGAFEAARVRIAEACSKAGIVAGIHANARLVPKHREAGYRMITVSSDVGALFSGVAGDLRSAREA